MQPLQILSQAALCAVSDGSGSLRHVRWLPTLGNRNCNQSESRHGRVHPYHHLPRSVENNIRYRDQSGYRLLHSPQIKYQEILPSVLSYSGKAPSHSGELSLLASPDWYSGKNSLKMCGSYPILHRKCLRRKKHGSSLQWYDPALLFWSDQGFSDFFLPNVPFPEFQSPSPDDCGKDHCLYWPFPVPPRYQNPCPVPLSYPRSLSNHPAAF